MKAMIATVVIAVTLAFATTSAYAGRVANTAIGTLTGLVVFGPVGAVAGAAVGYTAGHGIARSWGLSRPHRTESRRVQRREERAVSSVPVPRSKPVDSRPAERAY
jgi:outer membrane lipoprotein SlyB